MQYAMTCLSALLTTTMLTSVYAKEQNSVLPLDTITVYATRSPQSTFDVPAIVSTINMDSSGNALSGDIKDLLEFIPAVEVNNGPRRNGQTVSIRSFNDEAIITLVDGRRQNFESAHDGRFFVDLSLLKSVEIVKGSSSAIYGGGGIGGVIAFETKDAADFLDTDKTSGATTSFGYRSANSEFSPAFTWFGRTDGWDILNSISYRNSGNIEQGNNSKLNTDDQVVSELFKVNYNFNNFHTLKFQAQFLNNNGQEPNNGARYITYSNPIVDKKVEDKQFSLKYIFNDPDNNWLNPKLHIYYNDTAVKEKDTMGGNAGRLQVRELNTIGLTIDNQTKFISNNIQKHTLSYGFEIYNNKQNGKSSTTGTRAGVPNAEATNYGFYLQDEIILKTSVGSFLIIPAARFDNYKSNDKNSNSQDKSQTSLKLSLSYKPTNSIMFFGSYSQAFRAPNLTELYPTGQHFPGFPPRFPNNKFVPSPNLKPETVTTMELGAGLDFNNIFYSNDRIKIKGTWFTNDAENFITQIVNVKAGTTRNFNVPNATLTGLEIEGQYHLHPIMAKLGLSYVEAENDDTGEYLSNNVPLTFVADIAYNLNSINSMIGWRSRFANKNDKVGITDTVTTGYTVHDLYYRWTPNNKNLKTLTVDIGIDNIFDKAYTKRFATLIEEGRNYGIKVSYKW